MKNWEFLFKPVIRERGMDYYLDGKVKNLEKTDTGYEALVEGSEDYFVEITEKDGEILDLYCGCPYAEDGKHCKHMAAVLYEIENREKHDVQTRETFEDMISDENNDPEAVIENMSEKQAKKALASLLRKYPELFREFKLCTMEETTPQSMEVYKREIERIVHTYEDESGYIDYYEVLGFVIEMSSFIYEILQEKLTECGKFKEAAELTFYLTDALSYLEIDDSDGSLYEISQQLAEIWAEIAENGNEEARKMLFAWLEKNIEHCRTEFFQDGMEYVYFAFFKEKEFFSQKQRIAERILEKLETEETADEYELVKWAAYKLELLREDGNCEKEQNDLMKKYWRFAEIRKIAAEELLAEGKQEEAAAVLDESKKLDHKYAGLVNEYRWILAEIYGKGSEKYRQEIYELVLHTYGMDFEKAFTLLKEEYGKEEWKQIREQLFKHIKDSDKLRKLYIKEGLYDRLTESLKSENSVYTVSTYEDILKQHCPDQLAALYVMALCREADRIYATRSQYRKLTGYLKHLRTFPGGKEAAEKIAEEWKKRYSRRRAMMEELQMAGF